MVDIIIIPGNTDLNRGDQALVWESMELLKDSFDEVSFSILESGTKKEDIFLQSAQTRKLDVTMLPKILKHPRRISERWLGSRVSYSFLTYILWGVQAIFDLFYTSLQISRFKFIRKLGWLFLSRSEKNTILKFKKTDLVVIKGGGFIHSYGKLSDFYTQYFSLYHALLGICYNKKLIIFPNSIGPVKGYFTKKLVTYVLNKCNLLTLREEVSKVYLSEHLKIDGTLFPDLGFYLKEKSKIDYLEYYSRRNIPITDNKTIGLTLRPYRFPKSVDPDQKYKNYINQIVDFTENMVSKNYNIIYFAHTLGPSSHEDDRLAIKKVLENINPQLKTNVFYIEDFDLDSKDLMGLYSHLDVMVGTRFHSVIFALNVNVPCVAIAYGGNKSFGIMKEMDLTKFVFPIENFSSLDLIDSVLKIEKFRTDYINKIKAYRIYLNTSRVALIQKIKEVFN